MPANPREAGRKGGKSRSAAKLAAARRNGFQKLEPAQPATNTTAQKGTLLTVPPKAGEEK